MADTITQSRTPQVLVLITGVALAVAAVVGWYLYFAEADEKSALADEISDYRQQLEARNDRVRALDEQVRELTNQNQTVAESLAQSHRKTGELESTAQQ